MDKNAKIALILSATDKASAVLNKAFNTAERRSKSLQKASKSIGEIGDKALVAGGVMTAFFAKTVHDARESEIAQQKLIQGFITMGSTAKRAQDQIDWAGRMQFKLGVEDEDIMNVQGKLATFKRAMRDSAIDSGIFNRAVQAAFDLQAKGFGDAMSNVTQLGKALQNPALGSMGLAKSGAINKEDLPILKQIQLVKGVAAAQAFLMNKIEKQVKGTAEKTADPLKIMELEFHETSETIGRQLLPEVQKLAKKIAEVLPKVISFVERHKGLIIVLAKAGVLLLAFGGIMKTISFVLSGFSSAFKIAGWMIKLLSGQLRIGAKIAKLSIEVYSRLRGPILLLVNVIRFTVIPAIQQAGVAIAEFGVALLANPITWYVAAAVAVGTAAYFIIKNWKPISAFFSRVWKATVKAFTWAWSKMKQVLGYTPMGVIQKNWGPISGFFSDIGSGIVKGVTSAWTWLKNFWPKFIELGKNIILGISKGMLQMILHPVNTMIKIIRRIEKIPIFGSNKSVITQVQKVRMIERAAAGIDPVKSYPPIGQLRVAYAPAGRNASSGGNNTQIHFSPTINLHGSATMEDGSRITDSTKEDFKRLLREHESQKRRRAF